MKTYIVNFDSTTAQILWQNEGQFEEQPLLSVSRFSLGSASEDEFYSDLANEIEMISLFKKRMKLILRASSQEKKRLERHLSARIKGRLMTSAEEYFG